MPRDPWEWKMQLRLTETAINAAIRRASETGARQELADATLPGLRLRISPGGARSWVLGMRDQLGRARRFALGEFPATGISAAREAARAMRQHVRAGADPIAERRRLRAMAASARQGEGTLRALLDAYSETIEAAPRSWPNGRRTVERVFASVLDQPAETLTVSDLLLAADRYKAQASAAFAVRTLRPVLKWGAARGLAPATLALVARRDPVRRRSRVLSRAELQTILPVLTGSTRPHAAAMRLMLWTLARREEVCGAQWSAFDLDAGQWTIPADSAKNHQAHIVPLPRQAVALLRAQRPDTPAPERLVFLPMRSRRRKGEVQPGAAPGADEPRRSLPPPKLGNWDRETKAIAQASGTGGWHRHDLRRTGATMLGEIGILPDIIEAALNHVAIRSPLAATYNRSRYRPEVAAALQRLADKFDRIESDGRSHSEQQTNTSPPTKEDRSGGKLPGKTDRKSDGQLKRLAHFRSKDAPKSDRKK
jgi:integrase